MAEIQNIAPIQPLSSLASQTVEKGRLEAGQPSMFTQIFQGLVENVKETDAVRNEAYYALATGNLDNPAEASIAAAQALTATQLLVQMRDRALDAYSELMRISL